MTIIWCMAPEIWSVKDRIFCHFGPFFPLLPSKILLNPSKILLNQNFLKIEKRLGYIIILHMCTINDSRMKYGSDEV